MRANFISVLAFVLLTVFTFCGRQKSTSDSGQENLSTIRTMGLAYLEEFKHEEAEKEFRKFIKLAPGQKFGYANLGLTLLRMGRYDEAKQQLSRAIEIDQKDADIRLILATVYQMNDEPGKALNELRTAKTFNPGHIKTLYHLSEMLTGKEDEESKKERFECLIALEENAPGNIVPYLNLADFYIREGMTVKAYEQLEDILRKFPEFPPEATGFYNKTLDLLRKGDKENALIQFTVFHNYMKVYPPYQAGIVDLKGPGGSLIGFPLISFERSGIAGEEISTGSEQIVFTDVTASAGLRLDIEQGTGIFINVARTADFDSDGDIDLYVAGYDLKSGLSRQWLFRNDIGRFTDIASPAGLRIKGKIISASWADYDNDGFLDLYLITTDGSVLFRNAGKEQFKDVTDKSGLGGKRGTMSAIFLDSDHDGDLDIFESCNGKNSLYRNNANGTFTEVSEKAGVGEMQEESLQAMFGDFDEDGDLDFLLINRNSPPALYSNQRQNTFRDVAEKAGLKEIKSATGMSVSDYNNDGFLDLLITGENGKPDILQNQMNGTFISDKRSEEAFRILYDRKISDAVFFDYDNDGFNDLLIACNTEEAEGRGLFLFRNDGKGVFRDMSGIIPEEVISVQQIALFDYNGDGDLDILAACGQKSLVMLRNDGGNNNHFIKMRLVGLRTGSAKNNYYGIGAKVEIRAGNHYSSMVVAEPDIHFGLGRSKRADVIRITWTNGVPQNIFMPGSNQALLEAQTLKGSCPFLYTWAGNSFVFAKDILWRSALGMPLGIMGETTAYAFPDASDDYIKLNSDLVKPLRGKYTMQLTSELWETVYTDLIELVAVDHPSDIELFVPEQFTPPPFPGLEIIALRNRIFPDSATDKYGNNILPYILRQDDNYTPGMKPGKYQGITDMNEITLEINHIPASDSLYLFMTGWIFPTDASINYAISQADVVSPVAPEIQVKTADDRWITVERPGFPMGKDKTVISVIPRRLIKDGKIRIVTNMDIHWDQIFFAERIYDYSSFISVLKPLYADLHYRGFSEEYRKGGFSGPHWFDYNKVKVKTKWRDLEGSYTRYGNVLPLLKEADNMYVISNAGDEITLSFEVPPPPKEKSDWERSFFIRSAGWVKDGDLNTATGDKVEPLPFHGMKHYPYEDKNIYPSGKELEKYHSKYNTRNVTDEAYEKLLKYFRPEINNENK